MKVVLLYCRSSISNTIISLIVREEIFIFVLLSVDYWTTVLLYHIQPTSLTKDQHDQPIIQDEASDI